MAPTQRARTGHACGHAPCQHTEGRTLFLTEVLSTGVLALSVPRRKSPTPVSFHSHYLVLAILRLVPGIGTDCNEAQTETSRTLVIPPTALSRCHC